MTDDDCPPFLSILHVWSDALDNRIPILKDERRAAYCELLKTLKFHGYSRDDITTSVRQAIIKESVNENHKPLSKKLAWTNAAIRDLSSAIEMIFPVVQLQKLTEEELQMKDPEPPPKFKRSEKFHAEEAERKEQAIEREKNRVERIAAEEKDLPEKPGRAPVVRDIDKPVITRDESINKDLGFEP